MSSDIDYRTILISIILSILLFYAIILTVPQVQGALRGPPGDVGPQGEQGREGTQGIQGLRGPIGLQGLQGVPGEGCDIVRKNFIASETRTITFFQFDTSEPTLVLFAINYDSFSGDMIYVQTSAGLRRYYPWLQVDDLFCYSVIAVPIEAGFIEVVIQFETPQLTRVDVNALVL